MWEFGSRRHGYMKQKKHAHFRNHHTFCTVFLRMNYIPARKSKSAAPFMRTIDTLGLQIQSMYHNTTSSPFPPILWINSIQLLGAKNHNIVRRKNHKGYIFNHSMRICTLEGEVVKCAKYNLCAVEF